MITSNKVFEILSVEKFPVFSIKYIALFLSFTVRFGHTRRHYACLKNAGEYKWEMSREMGPGTV